MACRVEGSRRGLATLRAGLSAAADQLVILGMSVHAAERGHQVLGGAAPAAGIAPGHHMGLDVGDELQDL